MKRVTQKDERGYYLVGDGIYSDWGVPEKFRGDDVDRFAAYEDTGLEPEEIIRNEMMLEDSRRYSAKLELKLKAYEELGTPGCLRELAEADREGRCVVLNMPRKPLVWGDDDQNTCLCPYCGKDLMGIPYGERMVLQCPECGQYLDATKVITREEAEAALATDC